MIKHLLFWGALSACAAFTAWADTPPIVIGSAWYPEHSSPQQVDADLALMEKAGLHMARVGEFAWSSLEPREGHFTLDWLEAVVDAAAKHHVAIVIGTPTDAAPNWVTRRYPEVARVDIQGLPVRPGAGRAYSYASPKYRELCARIATELAKRFGHNPNVIGWQIGNEPTEDSYDAAALHDYHAWLKARYGTLENLNERWQTWYWSHTYESWDEIPLQPGGSPGPYLDYKRFVSSEWRSFHRVQIDAIRRYADHGQFITTNFGGLGWADRLSRFELAKDLDLVAWDDYVGVEHFDPAQNRSTYSSLPAFDPWRNAATHDLARGWKQQNFWCMEMEPAYVDWAPVCNALAPGVVRTMIWQAIGHGADGMLFWQWRSARASYGQYHGALVGPDNQPLPVFGEVQQAAGELAKAMPVLAHTTPPRAPVAILHDYDSRWSIDYHPQTQRYDQIAVFLQYYHALHHRTQSVDILDPTCDLSGYKVVVAPSLNVISAALARHLLAYVEKGGHLVIGPRSGMMDEFNALNVERAPGPLVPALHGRVEQYYPLLTDVPVTGAWGTGAATIWAERLQPLASDCTVVMHYGTGNGWLQNRPAVLERRLGAGTLTYVGALFDDGLLGRAVDAWCDAGGVGHGPIAVPANVELCERAAADRDVFVLINHGDTDAAVPLPEEMDDVIAGGTTREVRLPALGIAVVVRHHR